MNSEVSAELAKYLSFKSQSSIERYKTEFDELSERNEAHLVKE